MVSGEDEENKLIPIWVYLKNVPMNMYSWEGLSFITSPVGIPDHLHQETIACSNFAIAKVCVKADLSKPLPKRIDYNIGGETVTVEYLYPWLPNRCDNCGKWGHLKERCSRKESSEEAEKKNDEQKKTDMKEKESSANEVLVQDSEQVIQEIRSEEKDTEEGQVNEEWVTPGKNGRSSGKQSKNLQYGEVHIATPSRYSALSVLEEEEKEQVEEVSEENGKKVVEDDETLEGDEVEVSMEDQDEKSETQEEVYIPRQSLPRGSKDRHMVLSEGAQIAKAAGPSNVRKKSTRRNNH